MKTVVHDKDRTELKFPCLMISTNCGAIYLITGFTRYDDRGKGVRLTGGKLALSIGEYSEGWDFTKLKIFNGKVELSND